MDFNTNKIKNIIGYLLLVLISLIFALFAFHKFYINTDTYQVLAFAKLVNGSLGPLGDIFIWQPYNRIGMYLVAKVLYLPELIHAFSILCLIGISLLVFKILNATRLGFLAAICVSCLPMLGFISWTATSDIAGIFLFLLALLVIKTSKQIWPYFLIILLILLFRAELALALLVLLNLLKPQYKKITVYIMFALFVIFTALVGINTFVNIPLGLKDFMVILPNILYYLLLTLFTLILIWAKQTKALIYLLAATTSVIVVYSLSGGEFTNTQIASFLLIQLGLIVIYYLGLILLGKFKQVNTNYLIVCLFIFSIYKTLYFQHLGIVLVLLILIPVCNLASSKISTKLTFICSVAILILSIGVSRLLFSNYTVDPWQTIAEQINSIVVNNNLKPSSICSGAPEAMYVLTNISSTSNCNLNNQLVLSYSKLNNQFQSYTITIPQTVTFDESLAGNENLYLYFKP